MMTRCYNPNYKQFKDYAGRGITVCKLWHDPQLFIEDINRLIGPRPDRMTLDRINNDGNYEPGNVRWASRLTQAHNSRWYKGGRSGTSGRPRRQVGEARNGPVYQAWWRLMQQRPEEVCERWHDWPAFRDYIENALGPRPEGGRFYRLRKISLYEPGNVAWVTGAEQIKRARTARLAEPYAVKHGMFGHPLYNTWKALVNEYPGWVHEPWLDVRVFVKDVQAELGPKPAGTAFRLIDPDGRYEPGNVCWGKRGRPARS
jgi:hypothetical protein